MGFLTAVLVALSLALVPLVAARVAGPDQDRASAGRAAALPRCTIIGTQASETLIGTSGDDIICALGGDDVVRGRGGDDVLFGSFGDDVLEGGPGRDELKGHWGADRLNGGGGNDLLHGGGDPDVFSGGDGADIVEYGTRSGPVRVSIGSGGADDGSPGESDRVQGDVERVGGGAGADQLVGNGKGNRLYGRGGNDRLKGGKGDDKLWGGRGVDRLDGRDSGSFTDALDCGAGRPDAALANAGDRVASNCENVTQPKPPAPEENRAPTDVTLSHESVAENQPVGTDVGTLAAADRDAGDDHRFTLAAGSGDADNDAFTISDGRLRTAAVFDFEAKSRYSIRVRVTDGNGGSFEKALAITVTDVVEVPPIQNAAPSDVSLSPSQVAENEPAGTTVGTLAAADTDVGQAHSFALASGMGDADNGAFTVAGDQLRTAQTFDFESRSSYSIRVATTDAAGATFAKALTITVTDVNDPPTAVNDSATVGEDSAAGAIDVLANDTDPDGGTKAISSASDPANGTVVLTGGAAGAHTGLTYQPDPNYCSATPDTFTYTLNGGSTATVSVTVTCVDDAPTAVDDDATVPEDSDATPLAVLANDTDPDGDPTTIASASDPANGTVVLTGGLPGAHTGVTYQPDPSYCNSPPGTTPDTFTYTLNGGSTATVSVTVTCGDDAPTAVDDSATVPEDSSAGAIDVLANDTDTDGGPKTIASASDPANGTVVLTGGSAGAHTGLTYQPDPNYCSATPDTFTYTLNGGSTATVSITVTCVDDPPTAVNDGATVPEDSAAGAIDVLANDTDPDGGPKSIASVTQPTNGTVVITGGGTGLTYQPGPNYCSATPDTFTYTLNGGSTATVSVTVSCVEDPPTAVNDSATVAEDSSASVIDVLANDTDVDGGAKAIATASDPANGTVVLTGGSAGAHTGLTYQPDPSYCNAPPGTTPDTFTYTLNGGSSATVSVTVTCADDPPTAVDDSATVAEDSGASAVDVLANDTDTDGGPKTIASASDPANGTVVLTGGSAGARTGLTYQPDPNYCSATPDTFTYTLNGGSIATVSVTVTCVDDAPTAVDDSATVAEDSGASAIDVLANDTDADGGAKTIASASDPANGTVVLTGGSPGAHNGLTYQPDANYCGPDTFTYTVNGGSTATVSMTVTCAPDDPVVDTSAGNASYTENAAATVIDAAVTVSDPDAGTTITGATVEITGNPAAGEDILALAGVHPGITATPSGVKLTLTGNASAAAYQAALRDVTYRNSSENPSTASRTVTFAVTDDTARSGSDTKGLTVSAVDDPPTAVNDSATVLEDAAATAVTVLTNDTDLDAGPKSVASVTQPANGTVVITGGGTGLTYQPNPNYCNNPPGTTPSTFTYTLNGGSTATVSVTVTCVNDSPVADDETFDGANAAIGNTSFVVNAPGDGAPALSSPKKSITGDILAGDSDIDGPGPLTVTAGTFATNDGGSVTIEADGDFTYINDPADNCADTSDFFDYTVTDGNATGPGPTPGTDTGRVTIAIAGCVWYVNNNAPGNSGTSTAPFDTLAAADTAATATGDTIYVLRGTGTTGLTDTVDLLANQRLLGEAVNLVVGGTTLFTGTQANRPPLTGTVNVDDANTISGVAIAGSGAPAIAGATGDVSGTIADVTLSGASGGLNLNATTGTWDLSDLTVTTTGGTAVNLTNAGTVNFTPAGTISLTSAAGPALTAAGTVAQPTTLSGTIDSTTTTSSPTTGISLTGTTGSLTLDDVNLTTTGTALTLNNASNVTVNNSGDADVSSAGRAIDLTNGPTTQPNAPDVALDQVSSSGGTVGINIDGIGAGTFSAAGGTLSGHSAAEIDVNGGTGNITYPGTIGNGSGLSAQITGRSGGTVALAGNINDTNDAGGGIDMSTNSAGTFNFSGTTKKLDTGSGAAFSSSGSSPTINLTGGGLDIDTTTGAGFTATGGGTVTVQGTGNTIDSVSAAALNVANTTIGANNLNFLRVSSGNATGAADPANGIVLNNTGASGGLAIAGDGGTSSNGSGGVIQNTTATGVVLTSTRDVSLGYVNVTNSGDDGIHANAITNFALNRANVNNNGNSTSDDGVQFGEASGSVVGVLGTVSISNSSVSGNAHNGFWLRNTSGTLSSFTVSGSTFNDVNDTTGANAFLFEGSGTSTMTSGTISGSTFQNNTPQRALEVQAHETATVGTFTVSGNTFVNNGIHASFTQDTSSNLTFRFINNGTVATPMTGSLLQAVNVFSSSQATGGTITGTISGNRIGNPSVAGSAGGAGAISGVIQGQTDATLLVDGNFIRQTSGDARGIGFAFRGAAPPLANTLPANNVVSDLTITNNDVVPGAAPSGFPLSTIMVEADNQSGADNKSPTVRADIRGNTVPTTPVFDLVSTHIGFYEYDQAGAHGMGQLVDTAPASADATAQLTSTNTGSASAFGVALIPGPITTPP